MQKFTPIGGTFAEISAPGQKKTESKRYIRQIAYKLYVCRMTKTHTAPKTCLAGRLGWALQLVEEIAYRVGRGADIVLVI